jgi:uncharacterized membrane protein HdeD (DUF308 family)
MKLLNLALTHPVIALFAIAFTVGMAMMIWGIAHVGPVLQDQDCPPDEPKE